MAEPKARILIVDDEEPIRRVLMDSLRDENYEVSGAADGPKSLEAMEIFKPDVVLLDIWMPGRIDGIEVLRQARKKYNRMDFIVMSGPGTIDTAVEATKLGAWDFVEKPLSLEKISILLSNIIQFQFERAEKNALLNRLRKNFALIGESEPMKKLKQLIARVAPTPAWVLVTGENGTGKELVAQNIHYLSPRASRSLVEVNCAAIPDDLIESELFGYEKGAFTGAHKMKRGKFDLAHGGTLFLDEIADMSPKTQAKILRILEEQTFQRVGGTTTVKVDVRVVAATNKNLQNEIAAGRFREDLFYRLNVIPFEVPPLRQRREDIPGLVVHFGEYFIKQGGRRQKFFSDRAVERMKNYDWPGNVRELRNFVERVFILTPGDFVDVPDINLAGLPRPEMEFVNSSEGGVSFRDARAKFEREFLLKKISENQGNISKTAEKIGLERSYLHRKIKSFGIEIDEIIGT